jgi:hypothetical protein
MDCNLSGSVRGIKYTTLRWTLLDAIAKDPRRVHSRSSCFCYWRDSVGTISSYPCEARRSIKLWIEKYIFVGAELVQIIQAAPLQREG